eukprot:TRINITY_DN66875_c0_g1_i1.p1 TRINITY_DN66875_c0_g1~~TRINITY_DN66875_c0_g1_i1.p1  ORF type:complete len:520 (+),score=23.34 TRINITY_DN66875_c0_g1_i1:69-1628(+)
MWGVHGSLWCGVLVCLLWSGSWTADGFRKESQLAERTSHVWSSLAQSNHSTSALKSNMSDPTSETTHKSWFERMRESFVRLIIGIILIPYSIAHLWMNERRHAKMESLLSLAESEVECIKPNQLGMKEHDGSFVHINSEIASGVNPVSDLRFPVVTIQRGCIWLSSTVEVYQWVENEDRNTQKDSLGGGETTTSTYSYKKMWSPNLIGSESFKQRSGHENVLHVKGLDFGYKDVHNDVVNYGECYVLPEALLDQIRSFEDAWKFIGDELQFGSFTFQRGDDGWYNCPLRSAEPEIGDCRVHFQYVPAGPVSILALQIPDPQSDKRSFGPYRSIPRRLCGKDPEDRLKTLRLEAAQQTEKELYEEDQCLSCGLFACLCCCCNVAAVVVSLFRSGQSCEVYNAWPGQKTLDECMEAVRDSARAAVWGHRLLGWLLLWAALMMVLDPLKTLIDIIPFLGPYLSSGLSFVLSILLLVFTLAVAMLVVSLATLFYNPLQSFFLVICCAGVVASFMALSHAFKPQ